MKTKKSISDDIRKAIALRAYHIWEREGRPPDRQTAHWQMAEAEILSEQPAGGATETLSQHTTELIMAVKKPSKKKATTEPLGAAKTTEPPAVKTPRPKAAAAKAALGATKSSTGAAKTVVAAAKSKKTAKAKATPRQS